MMDFIELVSLILWLGGSILLILYWKKHRQNQQRYKEKYLFLQFVTTFFFSYVNFSNYYLLSHQIYLPPVRITISYLLVFISIGILLFYLITAVIYRCWLAKRRTGEVSKKVYSDV